MENPPRPSPQTDETLSPPSKGVGVAKGAGDGVLSPKEPNTIEQKAKRGKSILLLQQVASTQTMQQQQHHVPSLPFAPSTVSTAPESVLTTSKPSPLLYPSHHQSANSFSSSASAVVDRCSSSTQSHQEQVDFTVPTAPPLRFTSSIFSDASLPIPDLAASKSFGPNGILQPATLQATTSMGQPLIEGALLKTPVPTNTFPPDASGDLAIAANALLDLTPAVAAVATKKRNSTSTNNKSNDDDDRKPAPKRGKPAAFVSAMRQSANAESAVAATTGNTTTRQEQTFSRARTLLEVPLTRSIIACKCKNSQCLKLYCQCFQSGAVCDELICVCKDCKNTEAESAPRGDRTIAIHDILHRRPDAFEPRLKKKTGQGCSCKKSQ